jgi:hypothetical protein
MKLPRISTADVMGRLAPITLAQIVGLACGLAGVKIVTQWVPPADYGTYGVFLTFTPLGMWVVHAGLIKFVYRHWAAAPDRAALLHEVAGTALRKTRWLLLAAAAAAVMMAGRSWLVVFPAVFFAAVLLSGSALAQAALQAAREHWHDLAVSSTGSVTRSFLPPLLYVAAGGSVMALYTGYCLHAFAFACAGAWALRRYWRSRAPATRTVTAVYDGPLFTVLAVTGWAVAGSNRWIMVLFFGPARTGLFAMAGNLALLVTAMLGTIFIQYFQPGFFAAASEEPARRRALARHVDQVALAYTLTALVGLLAIRLVTPFLIGSIIGENYRPALDLLVPAGCFAVAVATGLFFHSLLLAGKRERACGHVELTAAAVLVTGSLAAAGAGELWFLRWLTVTPIIPWIINRPVARRHFFTPASAEEPAPVR